MCVSAAGNASQVANVMHPQIGSSLVLAFVLGPRRERVNTIHKGTIPSGKVQAVCL